MGNNSQLIHSMGMTLVHSLWEGALLSVAVLFALSLIRKRNSQFRYIVLTSGLLLLFAGFIVTFLIIHSRQITVKLPVYAIPASAIPDITAMVDNSLRQPGSRAFPDWLMQVLEPACPFLALSWIIGFFLISIRTLGGMFITRRLVRRSVELPSASLQELFDRTASLLKVSGRIRLRVSMQMIGPMVIGFVKPVVVVPLAAISGLGTGQIEAVLSHELAHIRRYDHIFIIIQAVIMQVLFFHPLAWILSAEIDREREHCCDDLVMKTSNNPINYIKALTMIQEMNLSGPVQANALLGKSKRLLNRIMRLVKPEMKHSPVFRLTVILLLFIALGITAVAITANGNSKSGLSFRNNSGEPASSPVTVPDTSKSATMNGTVNSEIVDSKGGVKKKVKIVFENDTIRELSVNGKKVPPSEMEEYMDEIRGIRSDMGSSERELRNAEMELERARMELEKARQGVEQARENLYRKRLSEFHGQLKPMMEEGHANVEEFWLKHGDKIQEKMAMAQKELQHSQQQMQEQMKRFREQDWEKYREDWEKALEKMGPAYEEFRKKWNDSLRYFVIPPIPPIPPFAPENPFILPPNPPHPEINLEDLQHLDEMEIEMENHIEASPEPEVKIEQEQSLDSQLRELEE